MEQNTEPRNKLMHILLLVFDRSAKNTQWGNVVSSTTGVRKTGYPHTKESDWTPTLNHTQKSMQNGLKT